MREAYAPAIAIVIPVLNEVLYINDCIRSLLPQALEAEAAIMVVDGGSIDGTQALVIELARQHPMLMLVDNPRRIQSAGINLAARTAPPSVRLLVRADAHAVYPNDFVRLCITALRAHDATSVVVPMRTVGKAGLQTAIAAVQNSRLGNGGAPHRVIGASGVVEHGHHAVFDRDFFLRLGGYDESFTHNEDAELDLRAVRAGGRIWMCREAVIEYFPRRTLLALAHQYFRHGAGRMRTLRRHHLRPRARQLAAPAIMTSTVLSVALLPTSVWFALFPSTYAGACVVWAIVSAVRARNLWLLAIAPAAMVTHNAWGAGFLAQAFRQEPAATRVTALLGTATP